jgi:hypothetical protein
MQNEEAAAQVDTLERGHVEAAMREGYLATRDDRRVLSEDWEAIDGEGWPE